MNRLRVSGSAFGVGFAVQVDAPELLGEVRARMPPGWRPGRGGRPRRLYAVMHAPDGVRVDAGGETLGRGLSHAGAMDVLESDLQLFVAQHARAFVFVHAGVVGVEGRAVVLPGTSGAGKTTLVSALLRAGATYYSDEYALLDARGRVHPYARALSVRGPGGSAKVRVPVDRTRGRTGRGPIPLGFVVVTEYCKGGRWRPARMTRGEVALALLSHTVPARERPREVMAALARAAGGATVGFRSVRGAAGGVARALLTLAARGRSGARLPLHGHPARVRPAAPAPGRRGPRSRR
ncbi:MAG TPA: hypothetical protein VK454_11515 [Myxococcaceae bacterium]|nr:hypothetical protein [Myxococcaceae bacterium]